MAPVKVQAQAALKKKLKKRVKRMPPGYNEQMLKRTIGGLISSAQRMGLRGEQEIMAYVFKALERKGAKLIEV